MANNEWDERSERIAQDSQSILERTSASLFRSNQVSIETEQIGAEVLTGLDEQRESLLRSQRRLHNANEDISKSRAALRAIQRNVLYNKLILILIILFELGIFIGLIVIKFVK